MRLGQSVGWSVQSAKGFIQAAAVTVALQHGFAHAVTPTEQMNGYAAAAKQAPQPSRGQEFFSQRHDHEWSCSSCHTLHPQQEGKHVVTGKVIAPMAPAANPMRFTDAAKTEKWFRRNCKDVVGRECTAAEKADFLAYLLTLKS